MLKNLCYFSFISIVPAIFSTVCASSSDTLPKLINPFTAQYTILHKSDPIGEGIRELNYLDNGTVKYSYHTSLDWLIFSDARQETSIIKLEKSKVVPTHYTYDRKGTGRDKSYEWLYDENNNTATDLKKDKTLTLDFSDKLQDKLSYHLQHRLNLINLAKEDQDPNKSSLRQSFDYPVMSTSGSVKNYTYQYDGEEEIMLPYGLIKTIKFKREVLEKNRVTYVWFAPELDYLLVKLFQIKSDIQQFEAQLTSVNIHK